MGEATKPGLARERKAILIQNGCLCEMRVEIIYTAHLCFCRLGDDRHHLNTGVNNPRIEAANKSKDPMT